MKPNTPATEAPVDLVPSLREVATTEKMDGSKLSVMLPADSQGRIRVDDRRSIHLYDGSRQAVWQVATLTELFRGNQAPPADLKFYPPEYALHFFFIENHLLTAGQSLHDARRLLNVRPGVKCWAEEYVGKDCYFRQSSRNLYSGGSP